MYKEMLLIKKNNLLLIALVILSFVFSLIIGNLYYDGDQIYYTEAFNLVKGLNLTEAFVVYRSKITSEEPIHFIIIWLFSNLGVEKNLLMSVLNALLVYTLVRILLKWKVLNWVIFAIIISNFYILVLFFSAERLKISILFLFISVLLYEQRIKSVFFAFLAVLTHSQTILIILAKFLGEFIFKIKKLNNIFSFKNIIGKLLIILLFVSLFFFLKDHLLSKYSSYSDLSKQKSLLTNIWQSLVFLFFSIGYSKNKLETASIFLFVIIASSLVGSDRITIIAYFYFMFYALRFNRGFNIGVILSIFYFGYKSIIFISNILQNGHGF